ncbi:hypothetical protein CXG81DRAFT_23172 [Caulochytrium protostelioides]|uniref:DEAD/DEAH box helicase domain-containing protein n=1 Tax=Caulochytrium protostelioides TaxID=1555241 RepID=A0A4P9XF95_9FUNG|nr:hypothetical protein CXG81DRAFT_23172 [Caulochytrium protostelioides]|eukprot:RKP04218.1 hypothetical protein CXG81DRAFT_23172 [Caulochytrium protostelioides]
MPLHPALAARLGQAGLVTANPLQQELHRVLSAQGRDAVVVAPAGSGQTTGALVAMLDAALRRRDGAVPRHHHRRAAIAAAAAAAARAPVTDATCLPFSPRVLLLVPSYAAAWPWESRLDALGVSHARIDQTAQWRGPPPTVLVVALVHLVGLTMTQRQRSRVAVARRPLPAVLTHNTVGLMVVDADATLASDDAVAALRAINPKHRLVAAHLNTLLPGLRSAPSSRTAAEALVPWAPTLIAPRAHLASSRPARWITAALVPAASATTATAAAVDAVVTVVRHRWATSRGGCAPLRVVCIARDAHPALGAVADALRGLRLPARRLGRPASDAADATDATDVTPSVWMVRPDAVDAGRAARDAFGAAPAPTASHGAVHGLVLSDAAAAWLPLDGRVDLVVHLDAAPDVRTLVARSALAAAASSGVPDLAPAPAELPAGGGRRDSDDAGPTHVALVPDGDDAQVLRSHVWARVAAESAAWRPSPPPSPPPRVEDRLISRLLLMPPDAWAPFAAQDTVVLRRRKRALRRLAGLAGPDTDVRATTGDPVALPLPRPATLADQWPLWPA